MKRITFIFLLLGVFTYACNNHSSTSETTSKDTKHPYSPRYANWFSIEYYNGYKHLKINNPWNNNILLGEYLLIDKNKEVNLPQELKEITSISIPVNNMTCLSSSHFEPADILGVTEKISGVWDYRYVANQKVRKNIDKGLVTEVAGGGHIDTETLLDLNPDVVFVSPYENGDYSKFENLGLNMVSFGDYLENNPIGRAEWILFMSYFFNKEEEAVRFINEISSNYDSLKQLTRNVSNRPSILSNKPFQGIWHLPGGDSYLAKIFNDAGADYIWKENNITGNLSLDFEVVYEMASDADFWRITEHYNEDYSYNELLDEDERFEDFKAFRDKKVLICNSNKSHYFERGGMYPDKILADFIKAFHPHLLTDYQPVFYTLLK